MTNNNMQWQRKYLICFNNSGLMIALEIPFVIGMIFCPESPRWLFTKGKVNQNRLGILNYGYNNSSDLNE